MPTLSTPLSKVFISYSHDSETHAERVLNLCDSLREDGVDAWIDRYEIAPREGWPRWMQDHIERADFVLVICTKAYGLRFQGEGGGRGVKFEGSIVTQEIYDAEGQFEKFIPVILEHRNTDHVPRLLRSAPVCYDLSDSEDYDLDDSSDYEKLYRRLTKQHATPEAPLGPVVSLPPRRKKWIPVPDDPTQGPTGERKKASHDGEKASRTGREDLSLDHRFKLLQEIDRGGSATVWKAVDRQSGAPIVLTIQRAPSREDQRRILPSLLPPAWYWPTTLLALLLFGELVILSWSLWALPPERLGSLAKVATSLTVWLLALLIPWGLKRLSDKSFSLYFSLGGLCVFFGAALLWWHLVLIQPVPFLLESHCDGSASEVICDEFQSYQKGWNQLRGNWEYTTGEGGAHLLHQKSVFHEGNVLMYFDNLNIADAEFSTIVQMDAELPQIPIAEDEPRIRRLRRIYGAGLVFRLQDENNYYLFRLGGTEGMALGKIVDGAYLDLVNPRAADILGSTLRYGDRWYRLRVTVDGKSIRCWIAEWDAESRSWRSADNAAVNLEDDTFSIGRVGLITYGVEAKFSHIRVVEKQ